MEMKKLRKKFGMLVLIAFMFTSIPAALPGISARAASMSGSGTSADPYIVATADELASISTVGLNKCYKLGNNIDLSNYGQWTPIGSNGATFNGTFDGNGHTITGLTIGSSNNPSTLSYVGLFGKTEYCKIGNVGVTVNINTGSKSSYIGGLVGYLGYSSYVANCYTTGIVDGNYKSGTVGGLIGYGNSYSYCSNSCSTCFTCGYSAIGGLIGYNYGICYNCFSTGSVFGDYNVGGLVGYNNNCICNCFTESPVWGNGEVGGFAGRNNSSITNCYETGSVRYIGNSSADAHAGGFVGYCASSHIDACYWCYSTNSKIGGYGYQDPYLKNYSLNITGLKLSSMKTQAFANILNANISDYLNGLSDIFKFLPWYYSLSMNKGLPYLD